MPKTIASKEVELWLSKYQPTLTESGELKAFGLSDELMELHADRRVWTLVGAKDGTYVVPGIRYINKVHYIVCSKSYHREPQPIKYHD
jgi:hypothetical protein